MKSQVLAAILFCCLLVSCAACSRTPAADPDQTDSIASAVSTEQGVDEMDVGGAVEPEIEVDFETGSVTSISADPASRTSAGSAGLSPSDSSGRPAADGSVTVDSSGSNSSASAAVSSGPVPSSPSGGGTGNTNSDPQSGVTVSDTNSGGSQGAKDPNRDTMEGFTPWQ